MKNALYNVRVMHNGRKRPTTIMNCTEAELAGYKANTNPLYTFISAEQLTYTMKNLVSAHEGEKSLD